jgi:hypothetical protein
MLSILILVQLALFFVGIVSAFNPVTTKVNNTSPDWSLKQQYNSTSLQWEWVDPKNVIPSTPVFDKAGVPRPRLSVPSLSIDE